MVLIVDVPLPGNASMSRPRPRPRRPFDWLAERRHRRGAFKLIRQAIKEGWLDGQEHTDRREQLVATLVRLLAIENMPTAAVLSLCRTVLAMDLSDMKKELAALKAELARNGTDDGP
jgi:hypothetical protein